MADRFWVQPLKYNKANPGVVFDDTAILLVKYEYKG